MYINIAEGHVIDISVGNHNEIGSISYRRWSRYDIGTVTVGYVENSIIIDN
jgi:hypothetical protein